MAAAKSEAAEVNRKCLPLLGRAQLMLAEGKSLEIWKFGEPWPISVQWKCWWDEAARHSTGAGNRVQCVK